MSRASFIEATTFLNIDLEKQHLLFPFNTVKVT